MDVYGLAMLQLLVAAMAWFVGYAAGQNAPRRRQSDRDWFDKQCGISTQESDNDERS